MITTAQAAARLEVQPQTVRKWIRLHYLKAQRLGRDYLIDEQELAKFKQPKNGRKPAPREGHKENQK
jgi:excisionase family DNA binding protein